MTNELIFIIQAFLIVGFAVAACRLGSAALTSWIAIQALIANLFVIKQINLFGFEVTASDTFAIGSLVGLNQLQEYFGRKKAEEATRVCFFLLFFFALVSQLHLLYQPSLSDTAHEAFLTLLSPAPRLFAASMATFFVVQQFDIFFFGLLQSRLPHRSFALRMALSLVVSQLLDTFIFSIVGLYGIVTSLIDVMIISFIVKLLSIFSFTSVIKWANR